MTKNWVITSGYKKRIGGDYLTGHCFINYMGWKSWGGPGWNCRGGGPRSILADGEKQFDKCDFNKGLQRSL